MKRRNPPTSLGLRFWTLACRRGLTVDCARLGRGQPGGGDGEGEAQEDHSRQYTAQVSPSSIPAPSQIRNGAVQPPRSRGAGSVGAPEINPCAIAVPSPAARGACTVVRADP